MKKTLLSAAFALSAIIASAATTELKVGNSPLTDGLLKFSSVDYYYFKMDECDFTKTYNVYDEANTLVGTVMADAANFTGYGSSKSTGAFTWTINEPGEYTLEIPEGSFIFDDFSGNSVPNAAINAKVKVYKVSEFTITTNLTTNDVTYIEDLDGIVLTFDGAEEVTVGSYAAIGFYDHEADGSSFYAGGWAAYSGTADVNGNQVTLNSVDSYSEDPINSLKIVLTGCQYVDYGLHGWIVDGVDITADITFYLTENTTEAGLPIYKADMSQVFDLQGRPSNQQRGLQVREGRVMMIK